MFIAQMEGDFYRLLISILMTFFRGDGKEDFIILKYKLKSSLDRIGDDVPLDRALNVS